MAYFAKGPLTRCRNAFQARDTEQSHGSVELVEFYREAILAAKKMDLKYREAVPSAVRDAVLADSDDGAKSKKRKSKKKKLGKNGLYPEEEGFIHRWWKDRLTNESSAQDSREAESKKLISDLRLRETQLQILLVLEVMVLEMGIASAEKNNADKEKEPEGEKQTPKKPKAKKPQDLNVLLELHLDRMCIWHAVSMEETSAADTAKASSFSSSHMSGKKVESDAVRDFCTEVIIPFYAPRVPDKCKLITRKFGVSGGISPVSKKTQSSKAPRVEPGQEVKRQQPAQKPRRTLQRVLTDEKAAASHVRHPGLSRSNTAPSQHNLKRDTGEPLLPAVLSGSVRGGIHKAKRTENREVDLNAVARQHETKLRKVQMLVDQKKELDAAIHALRKPNRELVSKDIADDAVKRVTTSGGSSRKSKNPVRNPFGEGVQVMATPRGNRKKEVVGLPRYLAVSPRRDHFLVWRTLLSASLPSWSPLQVDGRYHFLAPIPIPLIPMTVLTDEARDSVSPTELSRKLPRDPLPKSSRVQVGSETPWLPVDRLPPLAKVSSEYPISLLPALPPNQWSQVHLSIHAIRLFPHRRKRCLRLNSSVSLSAMLDLQRSWKRLQRNVHCRKHPLHPLYPSLQPSTPWSSILLVLIPGQPPWGRQSKALQLYR